MAGARYESFTQARAHLKDLLDAAASGRVATVRRDTSWAAVVDAERLRHYLALVGRKELSRSHAEVATP